MSDTDYGDHREYERHSIDFRIEVSPTEGEAFCDQTQLRNISGGGFCFITEISERYRIGLQVNIKVFLPAINDHAASMDCAAKVVWLHHLTGDEKGGRALVGLCLDGFMSFENHHLPGADGGDLHG